jgi:hypothetical protein
MKIQRTISATSTTAYPPAGGTDCIQARRPPSHVALTLSKLDRDCEATPSAEGAKYESQGQARSEAERVAPGSKTMDRETLKERNN